MARQALTVVAIALAGVSTLDAQSLSGQLQTVTVVRGETLRSLSSRFGVDAATIARDNGLSTDAALLPGRVLSIDNRHIVPPSAPDVTVVVNVPQRMLFFTGPSGVTAYPVAVGRPSWPTPLGAFSIVSKETNPTWDVPPSILEEARQAGRSLPAKVPPGPNNPLGAYWLGLSGGGIGIHGTNAPLSVYRAVTHGCIRVRPDDIAELFRDVQIGAKGVLVYQAVLVAAMGLDVFVEVHPDVYRRGASNPLEFVRAQSSALGVVQMVDWDAVARVVEERAGVARVVTLRR